MFWFLALVVVVALWKGFTLVVFPAVIRRWFSLDLRLTTEAGYVAGNDPARFVGCQGITVTDLRPCGKAQFGDERLDVSSGGGFIPRGTPVRVSAVRNNGLVVDPLEPSPGPESPSPGR